MDDEEIAREGTGRHSGRERAIRGPLTRLGGLTNKVFRAGDHLPAHAGQRHGGIHQPRQRGGGRARGGKGGVSPEVLHFDPKTGVMVTRFIDGAVTMTPKRSSERQGAPARAGEAPSASSTFQARCSRSASSFLDDRRLSEGAVHQGCRPARWLSRRAARSRNGARGPGRPSLPARAMPLRSAVRELPRYRRAHVDRRLGIFRHERPDVGPWRSFGGGRVRRCAGHGIAARLFFRTRRTRATMAAWSSTRPCATCCGRCGA